MATKKMPGPAVRELTVSTDSWRNWQIVTLKGKFVVQSFSIVRNHFDTIAAGRVPNIAIDMGGITQLDSSALTVVLNFQKRLHDKGGRLVIFGPNAIIKDTLLIIGFNTAVPIYNTRAMFEQCVASQDTPQ